MNRNQYLHGWYTKINVPHNRRTARAGVVLIQCEGGAAKWNPLNATQVAPSHLPPYNSVPVQNYASYTEALDAYTKTIEAPGHGYEAVLKAMRTGNGAKSVLRAWAASDWGTKDLDLMFAVLNDVEQDYWLLADIQVAGS
jgi:hypothetical protein